MSSRFVKPDKSAHKPFWEKRRSYFLLLAVTALLFGLAVHISQQPASLEEHMSEVLARTEMGLVLAVRATPEDLPYQLATLHRTVRRDQASLRQRLQREKEQPPELVILGERLVAGLAVIRGQAGEWRTRLAKATELTRAEIASDIQVDILSNRRRWPLFTLDAQPPRLQPRKIVQWTAEGMRAGALWPVGLAQRLLSSSGTYYQRAVYILFPRPPGSIPLMPYLVGFGTACILTGYFFCWLGVRLHKHILADLGLAYLFYTLAYSLGVISLNLGLL